MNFTHYKGVVSQSFMAIDFYSSYRHLICSNWIISEFPIGSFHDKRCTPL